MGIAQIALDSSPQTDKSFSKSDNNIIYIMVFLWFRTDVFEVHWPSYAIISDGRQPSIQRCDVCNLSLKSMCAKHTPIVAQIFRYPRLRGHRKQLGDGKCCPDTIKWLSTTSDQIVKKLSILIFALLYSSLLLGEWIDDKRKQNSSWAKGQKLQCTLIQNIIPQR